MIYTKFAIAYPDPKELIRIRAFLITQQSEYICMVSQIVQSMVVFDPVYFASDNEFFYRYGNIFYQHQN